jgi:hypothetical protein
MTGTFSDEANPTNEKRTWPIAAWQTEHLVRLLSLVVCLVGILGIPALARAQADQRVEAPDDPFSRKLQEGFVYVDDSDGKDCAPSVSALLVPEQHAEAFCPMKEEVDGYWTPTWLQVVKVGEFLMGIEQAIYPPGPKDTYFRYQVIGTIQVGRKLLLFNAFPYESSPASWMDEPVRQGEAGRFQYWATIDPEAMQLMEIHGNWDAKGQPVEASSKETGATDR